VRRADGLSPPEMQPPMMPAATRDHAPGGEAVTAGRELGLGLRRLGLCRFPLGGHRVEMPRGLG
jgi:hypothetical protein